MLDNIHDTLTGIIILLAIFWILSLIIFGVFTFEEIDNAITQDKKSVKKFQTFFFRIFLFLSLLLFILAGAKTFTPTTNQMAAIIFAPKVVNSDFVQEDLPKEGKEVYQLFKQWLQKEAQND